MLKKIKYVICWGRQGDSHRLMLECGHDVYAYEEDYVDGEEGNLVECEKCGEKEEEKTD